MGINCRSTVVVLRSLKASTDLPRTCAGVALSSKIAPRGVQLQWALYVKKQGCLEESGLCSVAGRTSRLKRLMGGIIMVRTHTGRN